MSTDAPTANSPSGGRPIPGDLAASMGRLQGVDMVVTVELGRTRMPLRELLALYPGSLIELDRTTSSPVDVLVNGTLLARGEVVVIDDDLGVRITEVVGRSEDRGS